MRLGSVRQAISMKIGPDSARDVAGSVAGCHGAGWPLRPVQCRFRDQVFRLDLHGRRAAQETISKNPQSCSCSEANRSIEEVISTRGSRRPTDGPA